MASTSRRKRIDPLQNAQQWIQNERDKPGFEVADFGIKGRGVVTKVERWKGDFLLVYKGEIISAEEGERREEDGSSGFRFFFKAQGTELCIDATEESGFLGRLVNHGEKHDRNSVMKEVNGFLCLFSSRDINPGEEILYDYGLKNLPWESNKHSKKRKTGNIAESHNQVRCEWSGSGSASWSGSRSPQDRSGSLSKSRSSSGSPGSNGNIIPVSERQTGSDVLHSGIWGAVVEEKGRTEIVYPMDSEVMSIGSAVTDDIEVKTAARHDTLLEVNYQGEKQSRIYAEVKAPKVQNNDVYVIIEEDSLDLTKDDLDLPPQPSKLDPTTDDLVFPPQPSKLDPTKDDLVFPPQPSKLDPTKDDLVFPPQPSKLDPTKDDLVFPSQPSKLDPTKDDLVFPPQPSKLDPTKDELDLPPQPSKLDPTKDDLVFPPQLSKLDPTKDDLVFPPQPSKLDPTKDDLDLPPQLSKLDPTKDDLDLPPQPSQLDLTKDELDLPPQPSKLDPTKDDLDLPPQPSKLDPTKDDLDLPPQPSKLDPTKDDLDLPPQPSKLDPTNDELDLPPQPSKLDPTKDDLDLPPQPSKLDPTKVYLDPSQQPSKLDPTKDDLDLPPQPSKLDPTKDDLDLPPQPSKLDPTKDDLDLPPQPSKLDPAKDDLDLPPQPSKLDPTKDDLDLPPQPSKLDPTKDDLVFPPQPSKLDPTKDDLDLPPQPSKLDPTKDDLDLPPQPSKLDPTKDDLDLPPQPSKLDPTKDNLDLPPQPSKLDPTKDDLDPSQQPSKGKWGAVAVVKRGADIAVYPMDSNFLSIGSAKTDDIIVKTAVEHEVFLEVSHYGEIYLVDSSTKEVQPLFDNTIFEVGGRALRWRANTEHNPDNQGQSPNLIITENEGQGLEVDQDAGTYQQENGQMEFIVVRDDSGFRLAAQCDKQKQVADTTMHGFIPESDSGAESDVVPYPMLNSVLNTEVDSTSSSQSERKQKKKVIAVRAKEDRAGKVDYSKKHACIFCGQLDPKIARHLCSRKHKNEELIARLPPISKPGSELQKKREQMLDALRNEGDFIHNIDILKSGKLQKGGIIVAKRPSEGTHCADDYLPCKYCLRFYVKTELWRHGVNCSFRQYPVDKSNSSDEKESSRFIKSSRMLLHGAGIHLNHGETSAEDGEFYTYVLGALQNDSVGRSIKRDPGLIRYGKTEFERLGRRRANEVRYRMRLLERVKGEVKNLCEYDSSVESLESLLIPDRFPFFIQAVRVVVGISEERSLNGVLMFDKPELAKKVGQMIRKFAEICEGQFVVNGNREARQSVKDFLFLYSTQWKSKIGSIAHQTSSEKNFNKKVALPLTEDLQKVQQHLNKEIVELGNVLQESPCAQTWQKFARVLLTKVTLFNFRRGNECAAMQVAKFQQRNDWKLDNQEIYQSLESFEQELAQRMDLVEVMGKQNKKVPVLLTPVMKAAIEKLIKHRDMCGVDPTNIYVFAKGRKTFIEGSEALRYVLEQLPDLKRPDSLRFPTMRKYLATVVQVFGMPENEVQEVARHMGHELSVHRKFYRLQDDVIELAKIAKLLLAVENGKAHQFKGVSLDDLDFNDIPEEGNVEETVDHTAVTETPMEHDGYNCDQPTLNDSASVSSCQSPIQGCSTDLHVSRRTSVETDACRKSRLSNAVRLKTKQQEYYFEDPDKDPDYLDDQTDSSDSDGEPAVKRKKSGKRKWTEVEKEALKPLVLKAYRNKKPPTKSDIKQLNNSKINKLPWLNVKYQVWAMAQQKLKQAKMMK